MAADIRGVRYTGSFRIPEGGTAYPSRPGGSSLSKFPTLSGDDSTIRQQFSAWDRIVQASMKAQNLSQLYDHTEYDDDEHKDSFNPFFMSTNNATAASIAQKRHYFDTKKQEAYLNLLMCIDTRSSATLNTLVESKDSFKELNNNRKYCRQHRTKHKLQTERAQRSTDLNGEDQVARGDERGI